MTAKSEFRDYTHEVSVREDYEGQLARNEISTEEARFAFDAIDRGLSPAAEHLRLRADLAQKEGEA